MALAEQLVTIDHGGTAMTSASALQATAVGQLMSYMDTQLAASTPAVAAPGPPTASQTLASTPAAAPAPPSSPAVIAGKAASLAYLIGGLLKIAAGPKAPSWQSLYFTSHSVDTWTHNTFLPAWLRSGPVDDVLQLAAVGGMTLDAIKGLPAELAQLQSYLGPVRQAADGAGQIGGERLLHALLHHDPSAHPALAASERAEATRIAREAHDSSFIGRLFPCVGTIYDVGMVFAAISSALGLAEFLEAPNHPSLVGSQAGRDAVLGVLSSASMVAAAVLPACPLAALANVTTDVLWLLELVNSKISAA